MTSHGGRRGRSIALLLALVAVLSVVGVGATSAAGVSDTDGYLSVNTTYPHPNQDSQAIAVTATFTPQNSEVTDLVLQVGSTGKSFVDYQSFSIEKRPGDIGVNVTYAGNGRFETGQALRPGETIVVSYDVYPTTIRTETLPVTTVRAEYVQNGQQLSDSLTASADLSSSFYFENQQSQSQVQSLQTRVDGLWVVGGGGVVVGLVGLAAAGLLFTRRRSAVSEAKAEGRAEVVSDVETLVRDYTDSVPTTELERLVRTHGEFGTFSDESDDDAEEPGVGTGDGDGFDADDDEEGGGDITDF